MGNEITGSGDFVNAKADPFATPQEQDVPGDAAGAESADHKDHNHPETAFCPVSCPHFIASRSGKAGVEKRVDKALEKAADAAPVEPSE